MFSFSSLNILFKGNVENDRIKIPLPRANLHKKHYVYTFVFNRAYAAYTKAPFVRHSRAERRFSPTIANVLSSAYISPARKNVLFRSCTRLCNF